MANDVKFEGKERRLAKIEKCLAEYGLSSLEEARDLCLSKGIDVDGIVKGVQPIAFENAGWAYTLGCAVAIKKGDSQTAEAVQEAMQKLMDDGTYTKILQHWGVESGALDKAEINPAVE